jgi:hypothetical protein
MRSRRFHPGLMRLNRVEPGMPDELCRTKAGVPVGTSPAPSDHTKRHHRAQCNHLLSHLAAFNALQFGTMAKPNSQSDQHSRQHLWSFSHGT